MKHPAKPAREAQFQITQRRSQGPGAGAVDADASDVEGCGNPSEPMLGGEGPVRSPGFKEVM